MDVMERGRQLGHNPSLWEFILSLLDTTFWLPKSVCFGFCPLNFWTFKDNSGWSQEVNIHPQGLEPSKFCISPMLSCILRHH